MSIKRTCYPCIYYPAWKGTQPLIGKTHYKLMRVGLDTSFLQRPPSGIGAYVRALCRWLPEVAPEVELVEIQPEGHGRLDRLGTRAARFAWETVEAGQAARRAKIDLLHMPMMAAPIVAVVPIVATIHDVIPFVMPEYRVSRAQRVNLAAARRLVKRASAVITPSHHAAADVVHVLGVSRDRIWVTHEAAGERYAPLTDPSRNREVLDRYGITGEYVFNIGGLDVRKNLSTLVRSFAEIMAEVPESVQLVIGGAAHTTNAIIYPSLEPLVRSLGLERRVIFTGQVGEEDKIALMQRAALYVTPSLYEGFGLSALEAMACGVPVIAANRTSFPEIIGDCGVLVEPRVAPLAAVMREVLMDRELRADLAARGLERACHFTWRRTAEQTVAVYRQALAGRRQRS